MYRCGLQRVGDHRSVGRRAVSPADVSVAASAKAGPLPARLEETTRSADEDDGQRGHVLHAADAVHLHVQVCKINKEKQVQIVHCSRPYVDSFRSLLQYPGDASVRL